MRGIFLSAKEAPVQAGTTVIKHRGNSGSIKHSERAKLRAWADIRKNWQRPCRAWMTPLRCKQEPRVSLQLGPKTNGGRYSANFGSAVKASSMPDLGTFPNDRAF